MNAQYKKMQSALAQIVMRLSALTFHTPWNREMINLALDALPAPQKPATPKLPDVNEVFAPKNPIGFGVWFQLILPGSFSGHAFHVSDVFCDRVPVPCPQSKAVALLRISNMKGRPMHKTVVPLDWKEVSAPKPRLPLVSEVYVKPWCSDHVSQNGSHYFNVYPTELMGQVLRADTDKPFSTGTRHFRTFEDTKLTRTENAVAVLRIDVTTDAIPKRTVLPLDAPGEQTPAKEREIEELNKKYGDAFTKIEFNAMYGDVKKYFDDLSPSARKFTKDLFLNTHFGRKSERNDAADAIAYMLFCSTPRNADNLSSIRLGISRKDREARLKHGPLYAPVYVNQQGKLVANLFYGCPEHAQNHNGEFKKIGVVKVSNHDELHYALSWVL